MQVPQEHARSAFEERPLVNALFGARPLLSRLIEALQMRGGRLAMRWRQSRFGARHLQESWLSNLPERTLKIWQGQLQDILAMTMPYASALRTVVDLNRLPVNRAEALAMEMVESWQPLQSEALHPATAAVAQPVPPPPDTAALQMTSTGAQSTLEPIPPRVFVRRFNAPVTRMDNIRRARVMERLIDSNRLMWGRR